MADGTSAALFGQIFELLARDEPLDRESLAKYFWTEAGGYDFSWYQMYCDDALIKLGLAKMGVHPEYPEDGEVVLYKGRDF